jgi:hypothetical protein
MPYDDLKVVRNIFILQEQLLKGMKQQITQQLNVQIIHAKNRALCVNLNSNIINNFKL